MTWARPVCGASAAIDLAQRRVRVLDQRDQPRDRARRRPRRAARRGQGRRRAVAPRRSPVRWRRLRPRGTRTIRASPWPPPPQSAAAPTPPPRRLSSSARCRTIRAPDMPIGWPSAIAPPLTLTLSGSMPSSLVRGEPDRGERLVDLDQVEVGRRRCPPCAQALAIARGRLALQRGVRAGDDAVRADLGEPGQARAPRPWPCSSRRPRRRRRRSARPTRR